jgi:hypothetical protein
MIAHGGTWAIAGRLGDFSYVHRADLLISNCPCDASLRTVHGMGVIVRKFPLFGVRMPSDVQPGPSVLDRFATSPLQKTIGS